MKHSTNLASFEIVDVGMGRTAKGAVAAVLWASTNNNDL